MWTMLTAVWFVLYRVSKQQKISTQYRYYPIPVNIAQYPITQYQYRSNPNKLCPYPYVVQINDDGNDDKPESVTSQ